MFEKMEVMDFALFALVVFTTITSSYSRSFGKLKSY